MRELHGYHGEHRRHARDAHTPVDNLVTRPHDAPKHAAHDSLKLKMLDPATRVAEQLRYRKVVDEAYKPKHAAEQLKPQEAKPEQAPSEARDKPASKIAAREDQLESQREERRRPQRSWLPRADAVKGISDIGVVVASIAVALEVIPSKWDAVAVCAAGAVVSNIAWANRRWKERHGNRPEG